MSAFETLEISWKKTVARYQTSDVRRSLWQIANSIIPYILLWYLMWRSLAVSYTLTLLLALPAAGFMMRIFIIFHDAGHGSFFKSQKANTLIGYITGIMTFTSYGQWRHDHAIHHATAGDLDRRGVGDVPTMTVEEWRTAPRLKRWGYRLMRNPLILFGLGQLAVFLISYRFFSPASGRREKWSVVWTNLALLAIIVGMCLTIGWKAYLLIQLPIVWIGGAIGEWLFYVQHQFQGVYWVRHKEWDYVSSAMKGASYYQLPKVLQWFTGSIGFHHIHHLSPKIPNYNLERCHKENPIFHPAKTLTLWTSLHALGLRMYDEASGKMVGFGAINKTT